MSRSTLITGTVIAIAVLAIAHLALGLPIAVVIVAGLVGMFLIWRADQAPEGSGNGEPLESAPEAVPPWVDSCRRLVQMNFDLRERAGPAASTAAIETSVDRLRALLPTLAEQSFGGELSWTVNRMAKDYLPRIVDPFLRLTDEQQAEREPELLKSLEGLHAELANVEEIVDGRLEADFKTKAAFLRARFLDSSS